MSLPDVPLTKEDFIKSQWEEVLKQVSEKECLSYSKAFFTKAKEAEVVGDTSSYAVFTLLAKVTSVIVELGLKNDSFLTASAYLGGVNNPHLLLLLELVETAEDPEIRARIADILWHIKPNSNNARLAEICRLAAKSYLQSAKVLENPQDWMLCSDRVERAAHLAAAIDRKKAGGIFSNAIAYIEDVIARYESEDSEFLCGSMMKLLQRYRQGEPAKYAALAGSKAVRAEAAQDFYDAVAYRTIQAEWHKLDGNDKGCRTARILVAEANVWYGEDALSSPQPNYAVASGRIKAGIKALRKIGNTQNRIQELHNKLLEYQKNSTSQLATILLDSNDFEDPKLNEQARNLIRGKTIQDALYALVFGCRLIPKIADLRAGVEESAKITPLLHLIPITLMDQEGKTKALSGGAEIEEQNWMFQHARFHHEWVGRNFVEVAIEQINLEHGVRLCDLSFIVTSNPFIPVGREHIYARGFLAGLQGDFLIATHLLVPQLENSMRYILSQSGLIASGLGSEDSRTELNLNKTLDMPELKQLLPEDIIFNLKGLLIERFGSNHRNELVHGLVDHVHFFSPGLSYLWWLILYLCLLPKFKQMHMNQAETA